MISRDIKIGKETIKCSASSLTPILYRQIFNSDFMVEMRQLTKLKEAHGKPVTELTAEQYELLSKETEPFERLAFILKEEGSGKTSKELFSLSIYDFYDWLIQFNPDTFKDPTLLNELVGLWKANTDDSHIEPKN